MAPVENNVVTKKEAPSYTHVEAHQFQPILFDSSPEGKLMDLINNKGWDGHTVYDRKKDILTTALYLAAEAENTSVISWLLEWSPAERILEADSDGRTALHAAKTSKTFLWLILGLEDELRKQAVNGADKKGNTPLHIAVKEQNMEVIGGLLAFKADPCQKNNEGDAPLHLAVKSGNLEILELLLSHDVDTPDSGEETPLHLAVKGGNLKVLKEPLSDEGQTPLDLAVSYGNQDMVAMLLDKGADPCRKNEEGESPLHLAALQVKVNESQVFQLLLHTALKARLKKAESVEDIANALEEVRKQENGAFTEALEALKYSWNIDNDVVYANKTALHLASEIGNETLVKALLKSKPDGRVVNLQDELGNTALHFAASGGYLEIVKLLLDASADVKQQNKKGDSPLHFAVNGPQGKDEIVTELLKAGAEINKRNGLGQTPLHFAVAQQRADIAGKLADKGANFHLEDNTGAGVLHFAARGGGPDIFKLLKDNLKEEGLDVNRATKAGLTPLHFAAWNGNWLALAWLLDPEFKGMIKLDAQDKVENGLPWQWAAMGGKEECLEKLIREHVQRGIQVFPGSHKDWKRVFQRIEDHKQAHMIDMVSWHFLSVMEGLFSESEESQVGNGSLVLEAGILSSAAAYGDDATNDLLVRVLRNQLKRSADSEDSVKKVQQKIIDSGLMAWAAWSSTRSPKFGGTRRFSAVKVVMEFLMKYPNVEEINNQLKLAFEIAFSKAQERDFAKCMAECFTLELLNIIKDVISKELVKELEDKYQRLSSKYKDAFNNKSQLVEDVPVAYWVAKLEEDTKGPALYTKKKRRDDDEGGEQRKQLAQHMKQWSEKSIKDYPNDTGRHTGRTALHWAVIFKEPEMVIALCAKGCEPNIYDSFGKPPYWYAQKIRELEENTVVMNCLKWSGYPESLHKDRQMFVDGLNAILVGSALIASVTFGGFLSPPLEYKLKFKDREYVSMDITGVQVFWVANSLSFFFAMGSALAGVTGVLPSPDKFDLKLLGHLRLTLITAAVLLVLSIIFVLVAFGAAGFSALPPLLKYQRNMIYPSVPGALVCIGPLYTFLYAIYNLKSRSLRSLLHLSDGQKSTAVSKQGFKVEDDNNKTLEELLRPKWHQVILSSKLPEELQRELLCGKRKIPEELQREPETLREKLEEVVKLVNIVAWVGKERFGELCPPQSPRRYTRNGQLPWEDGLDSLVQMDGDESLHTSRVQRRVQDERAGASEARTDQEDEGRSGQTVITVTHS